MGLHEAELEQRVANLIRVGVVEEVDCKRIRARVRLGKLLVTDWLPMPALRAGHVRIWAPLKKGEQVLIAAPSGELGLATIVGSYFHENSAAPSKDQDAVVLVWDNGDRIEYKPDHLTIQIKKGEIILDAPDVTVTGKLTVQKGAAIKGNVQVTGGNVTVSGDVVAGLLSVPVSLQTHVHISSVPGVVTTPSLPTPATLATAAAGAERLMTEVAKAAKKEIEKN
ncbi:phage baseplate assembly protein V [Candidatus Regiella insecticola]|uniref:Putative phage baseplate protein n=1 Tax=Candidatus Regiella insecticola TaxID=138073 RepID=A0A6L2ZS80_9ENTR|nr:phage baseplate assembly protein V [Candidatus Regiella insecticola]GFN47422.1 putative phage baseplate protein [Candidatus Regiella insecticola]